MEKAEIVTDVEKFEKRHPQAATVVDTQSPMNAVMVAVEKGYAPEFIEKMMDLQDRYEEKEARKAFVRAMASFRNESIFISKDKKNLQYDSMYTSKGNLINTVSPFLGKYGFTYRFDFQNGNPITVTCILTHQEGHSESVSISGPLDDSGKKNALQQIKSTKTYLEIATFEAVTGLASQDGAADDDGNGYSKHVTEQQAKDIESLCSEVHADVDKLLKYAGAETFETIPASMFNAVVRGLEAKRDN